MPVLTLENIVTRRRITSDNQYEDWDGQLTPEQQTELYRIFSKRCRVETRERLLSAFSDHCRRVKPCGILKRIVLNEPIGPPVQYIAGQDYPSEIAYIRRLLIASY